MIVGSTNVSEIRAVANLLFILLMLIGKSATATPHGAGNLKDNAVHTVANKVNRQSLHIISSPILLEETWEPSQTRVKYSPGNTDQDSGLSAFFNAFFELAHDKGLPYRQSFTGCFRPKYILFHALIIPSSRWRA